MFELRNDIPVPQGGRRNKYPFADMAVGESFFVPNRKPTVMWQTSNRAAKVLGKKFVVRAENDGTRVWRAE